MNLTERIEKASERFARLGGERINPPVVLPASVPLELSGEAVRSRLCVFSDERGQEQALRPDLTLPISLEQAVLRKQGKSGEFIAHYAARAFRLPADRDAPIEFVQVGFEKFGAPSNVQNDVNAFAVVVEAAIAAGAEPADGWFGDLSIFPTFVQGLGLPAPTTEKLKRAFRQAGRLRALLDQSVDTVPTGVAARLKGASWDEAEAIVRDVLDLGGAPMIGTRTLPEIVNGLLAKAEAAEEGGLSAEASSVLNAVIEIEGPADKAVARLREIAQSIRAEAALQLIDRLEERMIAISETAGSFLKTAQFGTPFGRRFNYYDGFVFELFAEGAPSTQPFAAGGRYDSLLSRLSEGEVDASAVGGVVRADRIGGGV